MGKVKKKHKTTVYALGIFGAATNWIWDREFYAEMSNEHPQLYKIAIVLMGLSIIYGFFTGYWYAWLTTITLVFGAIYLIYGLRKKTSSK